MEWETVQQGDTIWQQDDWLGEETCCSSEAIESSSDCTLSVTTSSSPTPLLAPAQQPQQQVLQQAPQPQPQVYTSEEQRLAEIRQRNKISARRHRRRATQRLAQLKVDVAAYEQQHSELQECVAALEEENRRLRADVQQTWQQLYLMLARQPPASCSVPPCLPATAINKAPPPHATAQAEAAPSVEDPLPLLPPVTAEALPESTLLDDTEGLGLPVLEPQPLLVPPVKKLPSVAELVRQASSASSTGNNGIILPELKVIPNKRARLCFSCSSTSPIAPLWYDQSSSSSGSSFDDPLFPASEEADCGCLLACAGDTEF